MIKTVHGYASVSKTFRNIPQMSAAAFHRLRKRMGEQCRSKSGKFFQSLAANTGSKGVLVKRSKYCPASSLSRFSTPVNIRDKARKS
jgi:hypothetical protein